MVKNEMDVRVARNIKRVREEREISRAEMEEGAGLSYGILAQIENLHKVAGKSIQKRLSKFLKTPVEEFYRPLPEKGKVAEAVTEYIPARQQYTRKERTYIDKLLTIFRTKDEPTVRATVQVIDTFLRVPDGKRTGK
ncbi:MAG: helix-turn-helix transcriptional regulator [Deltaproteobacteria bacterium]|nr:helix-turn-helix transcriptional regulator [Deltaproteobacteria bacterium]